MKKQILIVIITLVLIVVGFCGCTEEPSSDSRYKNTELGFEITPPEGWTVQDVSNEYIVYVSFIGPTEDNYGINIGITNDTLDAEETFSDKVQEVIDMFNNNSNISITLSSERTVNGMNAYELTYEPTTGSPVRQKMVLVEKNKLILVLVYSALENSYDTYLPVFEESVNSLVIE